MRSRRPLVVHRQVSGGARSAWGAKLVAMMFSFLETTGLQGGSASASLCELLSLAGRGPPGNLLNTGPRAWNLSPFLQALLLASSGLGPNEIYLILAPAWNCSVYHAF